MKGACLMSIGHADRTAFSCAPAGGSVFVNPSWRGQTGICGEFTTGCGGFEKNHESLVSSMYGVFLQSL